MLLTSSINYKSSVAPGRTFIEYPAFSNTYRASCKNPVHNSKRQLTIIMFQQFYQPHPALIEFVNNIMIHHILVDTLQTPKSFAIPPLFAQALSNSLVR
ncbi:MAG: hypothetical protein M3Z92_03975 [Bacteroidota bacterium]|nr:hypothetical protein [Bacteroidota bacterium]